VVELRWLRSLDSIQQAQVSQLVEAATRADGVAPVGEQVLREVRRSDPDGDTEHLLATNDGVVGYLNLAPNGPDSDAMGELVVHPDARGAGIGTQLLSAAADRAGGQVRFWAHGTLPAARALAAALQMPAVRELLQMRRSTSDLPEVAGRDDVRIRTYAGNGDDADILRVNNAAFSWHPEQGGWQQADIDSRRADKWFDPDGLFLAFDAETDELLGFHWTKIHADALGEVYVVGVDPAAQGRGLGRLLTLIGIRYLAQRLANGPDPAVMLYVEADNAAAVRTYRNLGFDIANVDTAYGWNRVVHV
jgi:mycothiol synthase